MISVFAPRPVVTKLIGQQGYDRSQKYRKLLYEVETEENGVLLILNMLTGEMIQLSDDEIEAWNRQEWTEEWVQKWFVVPENFDEVELFKTVNQILLMTREMQKEDEITSYTVLPTTDCNARCFYCYEAGRPKKYMDKKTAHDVADFIARSCKGNPVTFRWFGGEPLYNQDAINIICEDLRSQNITFTSSMVTNGYLFDESLVIHAKDQWNLKNVQITLDGTEEVYNRCKAFIYKEGSPFVRVTNNVETLLKNSVDVKIRMNMDEHNATDLLVLTDWLVERFGKYSGFSVYPQMLFDDTNKKIAGRSETEKAEIRQKFTDLKAHINSKGLGVYYSLNGYFALTQCMADSRKALVIMPDGMLGKCEHFCDGPYVGDIYNGINRAEAEKYRVRKKLPDSCYQCPFRPSCITIALCPDAPKQCSPSLVDVYYKNLYSRMKNSYKEYLEKNNA